MSRIRIAMAAALILGGCARKSEQPAEPAPVNTGPVAAEPAAPETRPRGTLTLTVVELPADVLMEVNGKALMREYVNERMNRKLARMLPQGSEEKTPMGPRSKLEAGLRRQITEEFITRTVLLKEAERQNIAITPEDEQRAFERMKDFHGLDMSMDEFIAQSTLGGDGLEMIREEARIDKLLEPLRTMPVEVTRKDMDNYTSRTRHLLDTPERVHARRVFVAVGPDDNEEVRVEKRARAELARAELAGGKDFAEVASAYSDGPEKAAGGDLGTFKMGRRSQGADMAFNQAAGDIGPVLETEAGFEVIQIVERMETGSIDRGPLEKMLANRKRADAENEFIAALKDAADIKVGEEVQGLLRPK